LEPTEDSGQAGHMAAVVVVDMGQVMENRFNAKNKRHCIVTGIVGTFNKIEIRT